MNKDNPGVPIKMNDGLVGIQAKRVGRSFRSIGRWVVAEARAQARSLHQGSIINRHFGSVRIGKFHPFVDDVEPLRRNPLGMFFYNQRAVVFAVSGIFSVTLLVIGATAKLSIVEREAIIDIFVCWLLGVMSTAALHPAFKLRLHEWAASGAASDAHRELPPMFDRYFLLDSALVFCLVLVGELRSLPLGGMVLLIFANTFVYTAYVFGGEKGDRRGAFLIFTLLILAVLLTGFGGDHSVVARWFLATVYMAPLIGMLAVTIFSVIIISWLRTLEHRLTRNHLKLLGEYARFLSINEEAEVSSNSREGRLWERRKFTEQQFWQEVEGVLNKLCGLDPP